MTKTYAYKPLIVQAYRWGDPRSENWPEWIFQKHRPDDPDPMWIVQAGFGFENYYDEESFNRKYEAVA